MKKNIKIFFYLLLVLGAVFAIAISVFYNSNYFGSFRLNDSNKALSDLLKQMEDKSYPPPACKQPLGFLKWENDNTFLGICGKYGAVLRMAAFQVTLFDPLPGEKHNVVLAAGLLAGAVVEPGAYFSLNNTVGPYTKERGFEEGQVYSSSNVMNAVGGGVCKIATTLYNTALLANITVLERHPHSMLVPYVPPGRDATVAYGFRDLSFKNDTAFPLVIWAGTEGNTLTIAIYGGTYPPKVTWHHELLSWQKRNTVYRNNPNLIPGEEKVIIPGADSVRVKSWLTIENYDGKAVTKELGIDYYNPMARVIEKIL